MEDFNYILTQGWMMNRLKLKGNELLIYSIIYGFSQDGQSRYTGSIDYLAKSINISVRGVRNVLESLVEKGLILKYDYIKNNIKFCEYATIFPPYANFSVDKEKSAQGGMQIFPWGSEKSAHNNTNDNTSNNNTSNSIKGNVKFIKPTLEEIEDYITLNNINIDANHFYDYYEANGWLVGKNKMKDWKATIRNWSRRNVIENKDKITPRWENEKKQNNEKIDYDISFLNSK